MKARIGILRTDLPRAFLLGRCALPLSDASALAIVCLVAAKLWDKTQFPPALWALEVLLLLLVWVGAAIWANSRGMTTAAAIYGWLIPLTTVGLGALAVKACADPFSWRQTGAFSLILAATFAGNRWLLGVIVCAGEADRWEGLRLGIAQGAAVFAVHPYIRSGLLGAGDARSYSQAIADFLEQWRAGIFPVFIGQSRFAFNGGFQPLRNAPYLVHLAWGFHLLSLGTLNVFALLNLTVLASILGGMLSCYAALRISVPRVPWLALGLAVLYGLCPGVLAPLYGGDMYPTFMTLPFVPWLVLGIEQNSASPGRTWPWALQAAALAAMWLAHPPVAAWATLLAGAAGLRTFMGDPQWRVFGRMVLALGIFLALSGYLFVSVSSLRLPVTSRADALGSIVYKIENLDNNWVNSLLPVSSQGDNLLGDVQLGYGLWVCLLVAAAGAIRSSSGRTLLGCLALLLLFVWPIPVLTPFAWRILPSELLVITNQWPMERFYVLLAAFAVFVVASGLDRYGSGGLRRRWSIAALVLAACLWSTAETEKFFRRGTAISISASASRNLLLPENLTLSRTHSYEYLGMPAYYSNGHMDPRLETRLLDAETRRVFADGSTYPANAPKPIPQASSWTLRSREGGVFAESVELEPRAARVLRFDFLGQNPTGELQIRGGSLYNSYSLPQSGLFKSFGSGPQAEHTLILENSGSSPERIAFRLVGGANDRDGDPFARVSVEPYNGRDRAIQWVSWTPFHAWVSAERDCYLETPRLFVPGYDAFVDGAVAPLARTPDGLVAIPLDKGRHDVRLVYSGSRWLLWSYYGSAVAWLALVFAVAAYSFGDGRRFEPWSARVLPLRDEPRRERPWRAANAYVLIGTTAVVGAIGFWLKQGVLPARSGDIRMVIRLPWPTIGQSEPLVTTGRSGSGDFIYVNYVDGNHVLVGHDKWGLGGGRSAPFAVDYNKPQTIEIGLSSLYPDDGSPTDNASPSLGSAIGRRTLFVKWNGVSVLSEVVRANPSRSDEVTIGENRIGGSSDVPRFSGEILSTVRVGTTASPWHPGILLK